MEFTEKFEVEDRYIIQQANQTIKGDPVLALVELVTNSDDSYCKMESAGIPISGNILIQISPRRRDSSIYEIFDNAMGMNAEDMQKKVKKIGGDVSGLTEDTGGRSYFGRGLKECMIAFGKAEILSIKDKMLYRYLSYGVGLKLPEIKKVATEDYKKLHIQEGTNGTRVRLIAQNEKLKGTPQFKNLTRSLSLHYSLRDIVANPNRNIVLRYGSYNIYGNWCTKEEKRLSCSSPNGALMTKKVLPIDGFPNAEVTIEVYRSEKRISEASERYEDERGFLICSKGAIHDVYHFGFENHEAAGFLFGRVTCYYFDHLLRNEKKEERDDTWINSSRDGIKWTHSFCRALERTVLKELHPLFKHEQENKSSEKRQYENEETKRRVKKALDLFNKIAKEELEEDFGVAKGPKDNGDGPEPPKPPKPPVPPVPVRIPNGMAFTPNFVRAKVSKPKTISLKVELLDDVTEGSVITLNATASALNIKDALLSVSDFLDTKVIFEEGGDKIPIVTLHTELFCDEVGVEGKIVATCNSKKAELEVVVTEGEKSGGGLFSGYEFDPNAPKEQRVQYVRGTGIVKIATQAPSIANYFGPNGEKQDSERARALLAELVLDACCSELARLKFGQEGFFFEDDPAAISAMFQFKVEEYKNRLAEPLHNIIAES